MKFHQKFSAQLNNSKLTVKYSEKNGTELACVWEEKSENESVLIINRIKIHADVLANHVDNNGEIREKIMKEFLNPKGDDLEQTILKRNLIDILDESYSELDRFVLEKRGFKQGGKYGF